MPEHKCPICNSATACEDELCSACAAAAESVRAMLFDNQPLIEDREKDAA